MASVHTDREYETELRLLRGRLLTMAAKVEQMVAGVLRALAERDSALAREMIEIDRQINRLEMEIDDMCIRLIALRQPAASDLRFIIGALKVVTDLERMGDLAGNVADRTVELNDMEDRLPVVDVQRLGEQVQRFVRDAVDSFVEGDVEKAERIREGDALIDDLYWETQRHLLGGLEASTSNAHRAIKLLFVVKHLERIADHATNIAEMALYRARGQDVRHPGSRTP